ncbi:type II toxin-antitoxin system death-on-curing family toxin [Nostoc sp. ChiQUE01b]|uniref:type II toxin-antitoxin system death-on-curing family toxin n=1 Tax=Nostoc sp. ChiQUE01b TaxID=3075376 RepID=UPI002AD301D4|nr:type II toxin-antitoxin system death-on-curing family toxin [Nostoc sp. ChiQUE01b]MDZ8261229.1 type II toxin-antitoxin system death-on-curing family toxin [Nostoc sp. ChiQUE01b]
MQTPRFISISQVLDIHQDEINSFGGTSGVRHKGLLDSALAQPQATFGGELLHPTIYQQAAAYLYHLTMNHPFIDGNKRTAFAVMDTFISLNGYTLNLSQEQAYNLEMSSSSERNIQTRIICISGTALTGQVNR